VLYLVSAQLIENSISADAFPQVFERVIRPSLESLAKMVDEKKLTGGVLAGQRAGAFIVEAQSNEEVDRIFGGLPFWGLLKLTVTPLVSVRTAMERDQRAADAVKASRH
jgi:CTP-dependent riboflavin kinase